jgi:rhodanese-related sulfurtransferase
MIRILLLLLIGSSALAQENARCNDPEFDAKVANYLRGTVPVIDVDELYVNRDNMVILDAREPEEYRVSHIEGAVNIGYDNADYNILDNVPLDAEIAVYCSIGYRSEKIAEKLADRGYRNVSNVYGGIFEWSNRNYMLINETGKQTDTLHTYSKRWSKWVNPGTVKRTW